MDTTGAADGHAGIMKGKINEMMLKLETNPETNFLYCYRYNFFISLKNLYEKQFEKSRNCECVLEFVKEYPELEQNCTCTSCVKDMAGDYPECTCNPWNVTIGDTWYSPERFHFLKCSLEHQIDYTNNTIQENLESWTSIANRALDFRCIEDFHYITNNTESLKFRNYFSGQYIDYSSSIQIFSESINPSSELQTKRFSNSMVRQSSSGGPEDPPQVEVDQCWKDIAKSEYYKNVQVRKCLTKMIGNYLGIEPILTNMAKEFGTSQFPHIKTGVVHSCDGYPFPQCGGWNRLPDGNFAFTTDVKIDSDFEDSPNVMYTSIAGIHTQNYVVENPQRSLECKITASHKGVFTITMTQSGADYGSSSSARCSWIKIYTAKGFANNMEDHKP